MKIYQKFFNKFSKIQTNKIMRNSTLMTNQKKNFSLVSNEHPHAKVIDNSFIFSQKQLEITLFLIMSTMQLLLEQEEQDSE